MSKLVEPQFQWRFLHPRFWLTWLNFALWALLSQLPYRVLMGLGAIIGKGLYKILGRRRKITERNLELCFPHLTVAERNKLAQKHFESLGKSLFETGISWFAPKHRLLKRTTLSGLENLQPALDNNRGAVFLVPHFTALEVLGAVLCYKVDNIEQTYRPHNNAVYDWLQSLGRSRHNQHTNVLHARDLRQIVKALRNGHFISFLPDQDYGRANSVFAPFYNIPAATVTTTAGLARMAKVPVLPLMCTRKDDGSGYHIQMFPPLENFPQGEDVADAEAVNLAVEQCITQCPEQYLWSHRRFKTRPEGEPDLYQVEDSWSKQKRRKRRRQQSSTN